MVFLAEGIFLLLLCEAALLSKRSMQGVLGCKESSRAGSERIKEKIQSSKRHIILTTLLHPAALELIYYFGCFRGWSSRMGESIGGWLTPSRSKLNELSEKPRFHRHGQWVQ